MTSISFAQQVAKTADELADSGVCALGALFDLTSQRLVRFSLSITRNQHDAEDAVQAVLVRVSGQPELLASATNPWAYLLQMVRNESLQIARRHRRCQLLHNLTDLLTRRRVDELEQEETHRAVWLALRRLPTDQAEVVVLKIWEELTFVQISEILSISPNTAASRYQYGMNKLTTRLSAMRKDIYHE